MTKKITRKRQTKPKRKSRSLALGTCSARWVIVGIYGLYVGQEQTRQAAIRKHCEDLYIIPSPNFPTVLSAWNRCRAKGDRAVRATISWPNAQLSHDQNGEPK